MREVYVVMICICFALYSFSQAVPATQVFATGLANPVNIKHAGDARLFVAEQAGYIRIVNSDGSVNATPFLDIDSQVINIGGFGDERGLLGLAFHPNYLSNGFFYVNYMDNTGNTVISRFTVSSGDPDVADNTSEQIILNINQPFPNHNGGDLVFGPDNYLYIAIGDGGNMGDPSDNGQNLNTLLGKILRIDVDGGSPYAIPAGNPFDTDGDPNTLPEIWAYGLRNPWKISFDSLNGDFWVADVGESNKEEINRVASTDAGLNYGWRCYEGNSPFNTTACPPMGTLTFPIAEYDYGGSPFKCAVTGGYRYRGSDYPNFVGLYFFADYCSGEIGYLEDNGTSWDLTFTSVSGGNWSAFGEDINGEIYSADVVSGTIYSIIDNSLNASEFDHNNIIKMYPNPTSDKVYIDFGIQIPHEIKLYNVAGKVVKQLEQLNDNLVEISTQNLMKGLYIAELITESGHSVYKKLIVK